MEYNHNDYADLIGTFMLLLLMLLMLPMFAMLMISLVFAVCCCFNAKTLLMLFLSFWRSLKSTTTMSARMLSVMLLSLSIHFSMLLVALLWRKRKC